MAYEYWLMQALAHGDMERVRAIQRLNSVGSYSNGNQRIDDEVLAVHGIRAAGSETKTRHIF